MVSARRQPDNTIDITLVNGSHVRARTAIGRPASTTEGLMHRASSSSSAAVSTTDRPLPRLPSTAAETCCRRRRELGGPSGSALAKSAASVTILIRGASLDQRMSRYLVDRLEADPSITVRVRSRITRAAGDGRLERLVIADETASEEIELPADALFIMIGGIPVSERVEGWLRRDENGFMVTGATS